MRAVLRIRAARQPVAVCHHPLQGRLINRLCAAPVSRGHNGQSRRCLSSSEAVASPVAADGTTTTDGKDGSGGGGGAGQTPVYAAFPWRSAPESRLGVFEALTKQLQEFFPQAYIRGLFFSAMGSLTDQPPQDVPELLLRSSRFAFIQVVRGIFAGKAKVPPPTWEYTIDEYNKSSDDHSLGYPPLEDMMDSKLASFYTGLYERFTARKQEVSLDLDAITPVSISDLRLIVGPSRGKPVPIGAVKEKRFGVTVVVKEAPEQLDSTDWPNLMSQLRPRLVPDHHYLFQMCVTFRCKERFMVTNQETKEVLQGGEGYEDTTHRVVYEVDFDTKAQLSSDFKVIDIDDWLGGNEYMAEPSASSTAAPAPGGAEGGSSSSSTEDKDNGGR